MNGELAKYEKFEDLPQSLIDLLKTTNHTQDLIAFANIKAKGVGQTTILQFFCASIQFAGRHNGLLSIVDKPPVVSDHNLVCTMTLQRRRGWQ